MDPSIFQLLEAKANEFGVSLDSKEFALRMDETDTCAHLRDLFHYPKMKDLPAVCDPKVDPEEDSVYFCGNSLGLCPKGTKHLVNRELEKWAKWGVYGHTKGELPWAECDLCVEDQMAKLVGAKSSEVGIMNGLTVNLHFMMLSFYEPTAARHKIVLESRAFPSDHYMVESQIRHRGFDPETSMICIEPKPGTQTLSLDDIFDVLDKQGDSIAVILLSGVQYYTGQLFDIQKITAYAQSKGILVGWDLAHAVGNVPLSLHDWGVDFACWCTYKYLNSGAGGIAGAFLHEKHTFTKPPTLTGWWGHNKDTRFQMDNTMDLIPGIQGYRVTNPGGLACATLKASLDVYDQVTMSDLRTKSIYLTGYLEWSIRRWFDQLVVEPDQPYIEIFTPSNPEERGCQLSLMFSIPITTIFKRLTDCGVVCDERHPSVIRIAPVHLYNSFLDVYRFIQIVKKILRNDKV